MCDIELNENQTVEHFGYLPEESLGALHASLALGMHPSQLATCSAYYRSIGQDPSMDELRLVDACITACNVHAVPTVTLSSLTSPDSEVAATLRSLIEQSKTVNGATPPLTLSTGLGASRAHSADVALADVKTASRFCFVTDEDYGAMPLRGLSAEQSVCIGDTGVRLTLATPTKPHESAAPHAGELIGLISLPADEDETCFARLHTFLSDKTHRRHIQTLACVARGELLAQLLTLSPDGCYTDLSVLCPDNRSTSPLEAIKQMRGYLICANETGMKELLTRARACGLTMTVFARLGHDGQFTLAEHDAPRASVPITLLHSLRRTRAVSIKLCSSVHACVPPESKQTRLTQANSWEQVIHSPADEPVTLGGHTVMHVSLPLYDALSTQDVQQAFMQCALHLTAAGGDFNTLCAAVALSVGAQDSPGALWSAVLGVHCMLSDWNIPSLAPIVKRDGETAGCLTICLFARTITPSGAAAPAQLRLFAVKTDHESAPCSTELRTMLSLTSRALASGQIAGLRPLWKRGLGQALATVKDLTLTDAMQQAAALFDQPMFGLFVRANDNVNHGTLLGSLASVEPQSATEPCDTALIPTPARYSLVHRARPTVLLPILPTVDQPHTLIAYLRTLDVDVQVLPLLLTHEGCTALADAMLTADIVLLNGDTASWSAILAHRRIDYALKRHLGEREGTLFALHGAAKAIAQADELATLCTDSDRLQLYPDGLSRDMIAAAVAYYR